MSHLGYRRKFAGIVVHDAVPSAGFGFLKRPPFQNNQSEWIGSRSPFDNRMAYYGFRDVSDGSDGAPEADYTDSSSSFDWNQLLDTGLNVGGGVATSVLGSRGNPVVQPTGGKPAPTNVKTGQPAGAVTSSSGKSSAFLIGLLAFGAVSAFWLFRK